MPCTARTSDACHPWATLLACEAALHLPAAPTTESAAKGMKAGNRVGRERHDGGTVQCTRRHRGIGYDDERVDSAWDPRRRSRSVPDVAVSWRLCPPGRCWPVRPLPARPPPPPVPPVEVEPRRRARAGAS